MKENSHLYKGPNYVEFSKHDETCKCDESETFLEYSHSIKDKSPFGPGTLIIFEYSQR